MVGGKMQMTSLLVLEPHLQLTFNNLSLAIPLSGNALAVS